MLERPNYLIQGEPARLIPVGKDSKKERGVTSVFLASLTSVDDLARELLRVVGVPMGVRARISAYTEVVFKNAAGEKDLRPDGLLIVTKGKKEWRALIEAKIGKNDIEDAQILEYMKLAKANGIDAVITISNQFSAIPTHHPVKVSKVQNRWAELYHWSWTYIVTQAVILLKEDNLSDDEQCYILNEVFRFLDHKDTGVMSFDSMDGSWNDLVHAIKNSANPKINSPEIKKSVTSWHQEERDLCLKLSKELGCLTTVKIPRAHANDPALRFKTDCAQLSKSAILGCELEVPDAASVIRVCVDLQRCTVSCSMLLAAPLDKQRPSARINWLLRQIANSDTKDIQIRAIWPGRAPDTQASLEDVRADVKVLAPDNYANPPTSFDVIMINDMAFGRFAGPRTFIQEVEETVPSFYENVGQHLLAWVARPPKIVSEVAADDEGEV